MSNLTLELYPIQSGDRNIVPAKGELLSRIVLKVRDCAGVEFVVFNVNWDAWSLIDWLLLNEKDILSERFPFVEAGALVESVCSALDNELSYVEEDLLYEYRTRHDVRFALRGVDVPSVLLGVGAQGGEVSMYFENKCLRFSVDFDGFLVRLRKVAASINAGLGVGYLESFVVVGG